MKVTVDKDKCIGCGVCADIAESAFEIVDGKSVAKDIVNLSEKTVLDEVKMAVDVCPVQAIQLEKD